MFLLGFEAAIWHLRRATTCFYWASKLPSGTFLAALKTLKTLPAALPWDFPRPHDLFLLETAIWQRFCWLRSCYLAFPRRHNLFLLGFETAIRHVSSSSYTLPAALPWDMSTNGVQHRLARGRGKENSAKRRRVNLTFPIRGASMEKHHISNFCFSAAGGTA